jgi:hypothetical protein
VSLSTNTQYTPSCGQVLQYAAENGLTLGKAYDNLKALGEKFMNPPPGENTISAPTAALDNLRPKTLTELARSEDVETNLAGGKQSYTPARFDLIPPESMAQMALVLKHGADKYGEENWRLIGTNDHVNHALQHLFHHLQSGELEDLTHALCRVAFAVETFISDRDADTY